MYFLLHYMDLPALVTSYFPIPCFQNPPKPMYLQIWVVSNMNVKD